MSSLNVADFSAARIKKQDIGDICAAAQTSCEAAAGRIIETVKKSRFRNTTVTQAFRDVAGILYGQPFDDITARKNILSAVDAARTQLFGQFKIA